MENKIEKKGKDRLIYKHLSTSTGDTTPVSYFSYNWERTKKYLSSFVIVQLATMMSFII